MNIERINQLIDAIRNGLPKEVTDRLGFEVGFDMQFWTPDLSSPAGCGMGACMGGHALLMWPEDAARIRKELGTKDNSLVASELLGIKAMQGFRLFYPDRLDRVTLGMAASVLERFRDTGEVVWPDLHTPPSAN